MSAILAGFSINTAGSPRRLAQRDTEAYWRRLLGIGGTDINANDEVKNVEVFLDGLYNIAPRSAWPMVSTFRSGQNAGSGTVALSIAPMRHTLVNGPTWGANGITFDGPSASNQYLSTGGYLFPGGNLAVGAVTLTVNNTIPTNLAIITADNFVTSQFGLRYENGAQQIRFGSNQGTGEVLVSQSRSRAIRDFYFGGHNANTVWVRANTTARTTLAATGSIIAPGVTVQIGRYASSGATLNMHGEISFVYLCTSALTAAQEVDIFNLYKITLGQGLGLP
jgi:hypothetical protein